MGLFSKVKDISASIGLLAKLCEKTWDMLDTDDRISFIFKTNKQAHYLSNGRTTILPYEYLANSNTLIIYYSGVNGVSYNLKYIDGNAMILVSEENDEDLCFRNRNGKTELDSKTGVYRFYFSKQVQYILEKRRTMLPHMMTDDVDKATEGLGEDDIIKCVTVFRDFISRFEDEYIIYLNYYKLDNVPNYRESLEGRLVLSVLSPASAKDRIPKPRNSRSLNLYIERTEDL